MAAKSDASLKHIWTAYLKRHGETATRSCLWDSLSKAQQDDALQGLTLEHGELMVLFSQGISHRRFMITTRRLFYDDRAIPIGDITQVESMGFHGPPRIPKGELHELEISAGPSSTLVVDIDPGPFYFAIWNLLRQIVARNACDRSCEP